MVAVDSGQPGDFLVGGDDVVEVAGGTSVCPPRSTVDDYRRRGQLAPALDPDLYFTPSERAAAEWLRGRGYDVVSVDSRDGKFGKSADSIVSNTMAVEIKTLVDSATSRVVAQRFRDAMGQAGIAIVDGRSVGLTRAAAEEGLRETVRRRGHRFDQIVVVINNDEWIRWSP